MLCLIVLDSNLGTILTAMVERLVESVKYVFE